MVLKKIDSLVCKEVGNTMSRFLKSVEVDPSTTPSLKLANNRTYRFWHFHTDTSRAGPTSLQAWKFWDRTPRILRRQIPKPPPHYQISPQWKATQVERAEANIRVVKQIEEFFCKHYKTRTGFTYTPESVNWFHLLIDPQVMVLLLRNPEGDVCGCVASLPEKGQFGFTNQTTDSPSLRRLQYLCIHPLLKKRGLAGWMLAWLDHHTAKEFGPSVHYTWSFLKRHTPLRGVASLCTVHWWKRTYKSESLRSYEAEACYEISAQAAQNVILEIITNNRAERPLCLGQTFDLHYLSSVQQIRWWRYDLEETVGCSALVGLQKTHLSLNGKPVWVVVYCGYVRGRPGNPHDMSMPFWDESEENQDYPKHAIDMACVACGCTTVLVNDLPACYGGGYEPRRWKGWSALDEKSNFYMYNWMPPNFNIFNMLWVGSML